MIILFQFFSLMLALVQRVFLVRKEPIDINGKHTWVYNQDQLRKIISPKLDQNNYTWFSNIFIPKTAQNTSDAFTYGLSNLLRHALEGPLDHLHWNGYIDDEEEGWGWWNPNMAYIIMILSVGFGILSFMVPIASKIYLDVLQHKILKWNELSLVNYSPINFLNPQESWTNEPFSYKLFLIKPLLTRPFGSRSYVSYRPLSMHLVVLVHHFQL